MKFLIDECLHESLVGVVHAAGFMAAHVNHLGFSGQPDRVDFVRLFAKMQMHAGLTILVPNVVPALQRLLFAGALHYLSGRVLVNAVVGCCEWFL